MKTATLSRPVISVLAKNLSICVVCSINLFGCGGGSSNDAQSAQLAETIACFKPWAGAPHNYVAGDTVSRNNQNFTAIYWTQANPLLSNGYAGSGQPWVLNGACGVAANHA